MRNTIKAKDAYHVVKCRNIITGEKCWRIDDGSEPLFVAQQCTYEDYLYEKDDNEMFNLCEVFTTAEGDQFIYWRDEEIDADYITKVPKEEQK